MQDTQRRIRKSNWRQRHIQGWRAAATASCIVAILVLTANIAATLWVTTTYPVKQRMGTVFCGSCAQAKRTNNWLQASINVVSSILLGASNFFMQCLSAPTRAEVDRAHSQRTSLQIGVSTIRNLYAVSGDRTVLWIVLGLAALPLHFL